MMIFILKQNGMKQKKVITNELFKLMILAYNNCPLLIAVYVLFSFFYWQECGRKQAMVILEYFGRQPLFPLRMEQPSNAISYVSTSFPNRLPKSVASRRASPFFSFVKRPHAGRAELLQENSSLRLMNSTPRLECR